MTTDNRNDATIAPFAVIRVAALPPAVLTPLTLPASRHILSELERTDDALQRLRATVTDALHSLVPRLDEDPMLRGCVVNLKRDVHNDRLSSMKDGVLEQIARRLGEPEGADLLVWGELTARRAALHEALQRTTVTDLESAGAAVATAATNADLRGGLAASSESFYATLGSNHADRWCDPTCRDSRTLLTYLARAALKTSPFSSFTSLGLVRDGKLQPTPARRMRSHVVPLLHWTLLRACATDLDLAPAFRYQAIPTWRVSDQRLRALLPRPTTDGDFYWRAETATDMSLYSEQLAAMATDEPASYPRFIGQLPGRDQRLTLRRLLDAGICRVVAPWSDDDPEPLVALADAVLRLGTDRAMKISAQVRAIATAKGDLDDADVECRRQARHSVRSLAMAALKNVGVPTPRWIASGKFVFEDVADVSLPATDTVLPKCLESDLQRLADLVRPDIFPTRLYDELVRAFVDRFGAGGVCENVMAFLDDVLTSPDMEPMLGRVIEHDRNRSSNPAGVASRRVDSPSSAPPTATVLFQLVAADQDAVVRGDYLMVVNQYSAGLGGLFARMSSLFPGPEGLAAGLRGWVHDCYPHAAIAELLPARDVSSLESASSGLFPKLVWPADGATHGRSTGIGIDELRLSHDEASDSLIVQTADGRPVATPHLGTVPDYIVSGPLRLLLTISNPWIVGSRLSDRLPTLTGYGRVEDITFIPRDQRGRLVVRRARWLMPGRLFPLRSKAETDAVYLLRVDKWRRSHGLPDEVYLNLDGSANGSRTKDRKPRWVSFSSLHALAAVKGVVSENLDGTVALVEALPGRSQHWARDHEGQPRVTELMTLLRWEPISRRERSSRSEPNSRWESITENEEVCDVY
jgi:Lantibiotic dehydratase, N terminus